MFSFASRSSPKDAPREQDKTRASDADSTSSPWDGPDKSLSTRSMSLSSTGTASSTLSEWTRKNGGPPPPLKTLPPLKSYFNLSEDADVSHLLDILTSTELEEKDAEGLQEPLHIVVHGTGQVIGKGDMVIVAMVVPAIAQCQRLIRLQILPCNLSDASVNAFVEIMLQGCTLEHLEFQDNPLITAKGYAALQDAAAASSEVSAIRTLRLWDGKKKINVTMDVVAARRKLQPDEVMSAAKRVMEFKAEFSRWSLKEGQTASV